jgi:UDP-N-acetylmuramoyl-L-alanyl-D-glutamate--2,6-diaminopimelate ligase
VNVKPKPLSALLADLPDASLQGSRDMMVNAIHYDSRQVRKGDLFVAIKGYAADGHRFIPDAVAKGAAVVVHEEPWAPPPGVSSIQVASSRKALASMAARFFDHPDRAMKLIGITGTNGKTTVAHMLWSIFQHSFPPAGMIGTIENRIGEEKIPTSRTTPESLDLQKLFSQMREKGVRLTSMEVSSHSLVLDRVYGLQFSVAVFTNLSHEHLDFHHTIEEYRDAKALLFKNLNNSAHAILNDDDPVSKYYRSLTSAKTWMYSTHNSGVDLYGHDVHCDWGGTRLMVKTPMGEKRFETPLPGRFNVYNLLAAVGAALALEISLDDIQEGLHVLKSVPGRFERVIVDAPFTVIVDYAHTPDALDNCLQTARALPGKRLITVFGCGGDRDKLKRPVMGKIAQTHSDVVVVTSDNPRTEDRDQIINDIVIGMNEHRPFIVEADRRYAIQRALSEAREGDVVVIAGKGHETYQLIGDRREPFDDRQVAREYF